MNKFLIAPLIMAITVFLSLSACGDSKQNQNKEQENSVVTAENNELEDINGEKNSLDLTTGKNTRLSAALAQAKKNNDSRLFATKGRRVVIVGIDQEHFDQAKKRCGIKFLPKSGDVLKSEQDKADRRANYQFAQAYNQIIIRDCLN
jgi:hypothetical protein